MKRFLEIIPDILLCVYVIVGVLYALVVVFGGESL